MPNGTFQISTARHMEFVDITTKINKEIARSGVSEGVCYIYNPHTTAGLTINEGADPAVQSDLLDALQKIVPMNHPYKHREGNSPSHVMSSLVGTSLCLFIVSGALELGTWQKVFFCEFDGPRTRRILWKAVSC